MIASLRVRRCPLQMVVLLLDRKQAYKHNSVQQTSSAERTSKAHTVTLLPAHILHAFILILQCWHELMMPPYSSSIVQLMSLNMAYSSSEHHAHVSK